MTTFKTSRKIAPSVKRKGFRVPIRALLVGIFITFSGSISYLYITAGYQFPFSCDLKSDPVVSVNQSSATGAVTPDSSSSTAVD
ncbi:MAG: hypothetical protein PHS86_09020, partial [Syntrophaceae bacterium]|nr:hypothetical protein [Syntrophaceae bacterium]